MQNILSDMGYNSYKVVRIIHFMKFISISYQNMISIVAYIVNYDWKLILHGRIIRGCIEINYFNLPNRNNKSLQVLADLNFQTFKIIVEIFFLWFQNIDKKIVIMYRKLADYLKITNFFEWFIFFTHFNTVNFI